MQGWILVPVSWAVAVRDVLRSCQLWGHRAHVPDARWVVPQGQVPESVWELWVFHRCGRCGSLTDGRDSGRRWDRTAAPPAWPTVDTPSYEIER